MDWFLYKKDLRHERVSLSSLMHLWCIWVAGTILLFLLGYALHRKNCRIFLYFKHIFNLQNSLIRKKRLISNFITSQPGYQTILIHILSNISRSKGSQTMKFSQLIECDIKNIFLEKPYTKCGRETSPRPFSEKLKLRICLDR